VEPTQDNRLQELIDWDAVMPLPRYAGGHDEQMKLLFKNSTVLAHWNEGDYQGVVSTVCRLQDGRITAINDYYGSCSGCDCWEDATDDDVRRLCIDLANGAKIFQSVEQCVEWLASRGQHENYSDYEWRNSGPALAAALTHPQPPESR
jgi:hypothetical protein